MSAPRGARIHGEVSCLKRPWSPEETSALVDLIEHENLTFPEIMRRLNRSLGSVGNKAAQLGLSTKRYRAATPPPIEPGIQTSGLNLPSVPRVVLRRTVSHSSAPDAYAMVSLPRVTILDGPA